MKSWKIGAIAGLIAGIVAGIVAIIIGIIDMKLGIWFWAKPFTNIALNEMTINIIWGIVLGVIYSKIYDIIPGKHIFKGLIYGIILGFIIEIRCVSFDIAYSLIDIAISDAISALILVVYGLALGILYEFLQSKYHLSLRKLKPHKHDIGRGIQAGAIAGLIGGIVISFAHIRFWDPMEYPKYLTDVEFLTSQLGTHSLINMLWGAVFGILFVMFYDRIPTNGISKGITFALIIFFITSFRIAIECLLYGVFSWFVGWSNAVFLFLAYGIILGLIYRK